MSGDPGSGQQFVNKGIVNSGHGTQNFGNVAVGRGSNAISSGSAQVPVPAPGRDATNTSKPVILISHTKQDASISNVMDDLIHRTFLGRLDTFNTANRTSVEPGDPWRDRIIDTLRGCAATLVIATPESVRAPWVNFESGGAWLMAKPVIPCCTKGMTKFGLPAPLGHLQALDLNSAADIRHLTEFLASTTGLDAPTGVDYEELVRRFEEA